MTIPGILRLVLVAFAVWISATFASGNLQISGPDFLLLLLSIFISVVQVSAAFSNVACYATIVSFISVTFISYQIPAASMASDVTPFFVTYGYYPAADAWERAIVLVILAQLGVLGVGLLVGAGFGHNRVDEDLLERSQFKAPTPQSAKYQIVAMLGLLAPIWLISLGSGFARGATSDGILAYLILLVSPYFLAAVASGVLIKGKGQPPGLLRLAFFAVIAVPAWEILNGKRGGLTIALFALFVVWMLMKGPRQRLNFRTIAAGALVAFVVLPFTAWLALAFREAPSEAGRTIPFTLSSSLNFVGSRSALFDSTIIILSNEYSDGRSTIPPPTVAQLALGIGQYSLPSGLDIVQDAKAKQGLGVRFSAQYLGMETGNAGAWSGIGIAYAVFGQWGVMFPGIGVALAVLILRYLQRFPKIALAISVETVYALVWGFMASGNVDQIFAGWLRGTVFYLLLVGGLESLRRQNEAHAGTRAHSKVAHRV